MKRNLLLVAILGSLVFPALVQTQEPQLSAPTNPVYSPGSSVDTQGVKNYLLGPGDVIDVRVFGQGDLNSIAEVDSDGNISSLPFLDKPIAAKCRTEKEIQKDIAVAYSKYLKNPQISVRIAEKKSRAPATVFGAVRQPTRVMMLRKARLNEVVATSGGFTERAAGTIQIVHTEPIMCPQPGEEAQAAPLDPDKPPMEIVKLSELRAGKPQANPMIRPGDYILVTEAEPVYVIGSVFNPQSIYLTEQLTLSRALAIVGGVRKEGKLNDVRIHRQKPGAQDQEIIRVDYNAIRKNKAPDVMLQSYDVIDVPEAGPLSAARILPTLVGALTGGLGNTASAIGPAVFQNRTIR
ncbi:MAG: polysaccharide biosynthesis/export family protein [Acidobacteriota bacterium]